jgi:Icc-related predicted phosphoesterase
LGNQTTERFNILEVTSTFQTGSKRNKGSPELKQKWQKIPAGLDILITHTPPKGFHDEGEGCEHLTEAVLEKKPLFHIFGHYHTEHGATAYFHTNMKKTTFINACSLSEGYYPIQRAIVFDMDLQAKRQEAMELSTIAS